MIRITEITLINRNNLFIDLFLYEMIKYQLNIGITLYEKIRLYSIRFDISLSRITVESGFLPRNYRNAQWKNAMPRN